MLEGSGPFDAGPKTSEFSEEKYLARIIALLGPPPPGLLAQGKGTSKYFDDEGTLKDNAPYPISD